MTTYLDLEDALWLCERLGIGPVLESIVRNHALVDGNERLGWTCLVVSVAAGSLSMEQLTAVISGWLGQK